MAVVVALGLLVVGGALLVKGSDWFTDGASDLARSLGVSALLIGIVLAGLEPEEMLTAAVASGRGAAGLAIGNVIGTNITIATLALGLAAALAPIRLPRSVRPQALLATIVSIPPIALLFTGVVSRLAGVALIVLFIAYTLLLIRFDRQALARHEALEALESGGDDDDDDDGDDDGAEAGATGTVRVYTPQQRRAYVLRKAGVTLLGLLAMALGGPAIVEGALRFADSVGLRQSAVGLTLVSLGTGAEMVALAIAGSRRRMADILVGGIIGSIAYNLLVTLGLAAAIRALPVDPRITQVALPVMIVVHLALITLVFIGRIPRVVGWALLAGYVAYVAAVVIVP
ncbi:MAG TPA: sodium:calcium antiporter [Ktedonobacterales bacterium]